MEPRKMLLELTEKEKTVLVQALESFCLIGELKLSSLVHWIDNADGNYEKAKYLLDKAKEALFSNLPFDTSRPIEEAPDQFRLAKELLKKYKNT